MTFQEILGEAYKEGMTIEEVSAALATVQPPKSHDTELQRLQAALIKSNSEAAEYKRQLRTKQTEDEVRASTEKEEREKLQSAHDTLLREVTVSKHRARLLGLGYDDALAIDTAEALVSGDMEKVFANQAKALAAKEAAVKAALLDDTPKPPAGNPSTSTKYDTEIASALSSGNASMAAYYTRLNQEQGVK